MGKEITIKGETFQLAGKEVLLGKKAPDCKLVDEQMRDVSLAHLLGKVTLLVTIPSIDTEVCQKEAKRFNLELSLYGDSVHAFVISYDLPFAQKRWCGHAGAKNLSMLSDYRYREFGEKFGVQIKRLDLLARAIFLLDGEGVVRYMQIVEELSNEPDYERALQEIDLLKNGAS